MHVCRRRVLAATAATPVLLLGTAAAATTDLAVTCDRAAAPAIAQAARAFRAQTGIRVRIFPTTPRLIVPQLEREIQNDIVVTQPAILDAAEAAGVIKPGGRTPPWRNRLQIAAAKPEAGPPNSFVLPDPTGVADFDGAEILRRMGIADAAQIGVIDTETIAWMLRQGEARRGLLHQTEITADPSLQAMAAVPDSAWPPIVYAATLSTLARRPHPEAFVDFLRGPGQSALRAAGLEPAA